MAVAGFAALIAVVVVLIAVAVRATAAGRAAADRRLNAEDSGVLSSGATAARANDPNVFARFDNAVRRSGLDASPTGVRAVMLLLAVGLAGGLWLWKEQLGLAALGAVVGAVLPVVVVLVAHRQYRWRLQDQLPDAYRVLAGSVRAGQTLEQAIEFYASNGAQPLAEEFAHCTALMRLGLSPAAAVQATAVRVRLFDFDLLASTVGLYAQTGGNLVLLIERLADSVRDRNQFAGQFFAATAQSRVVAFTLGLAAPVVLVVYLLAEPEHTQAFLASPNGWATLAVCALLEVVGVVWVWRILKIDY